MYNEEKVEYPILVVAAYSGCGKTTFTRAKPIYQRHPVIDLDSNQFSREEGKFPENYLNMIRLIADNPEQFGSIVFVSTHQDVLAGLKELRIPHVLVHPDKSLDAQTWVRRIEGRDQEGNIELTNTLKEKYGEHLIGMGTHIEDNGDTLRKVFALKEGEYIGDVIHSIIEDAPTP